MDMNKEILCVEYNPVLDKYYVPSRSRKSRIPKWEVFQSRTKFNKQGNLKWFCNCEDFCLNKKYDGECKHIMKAKFYKQNEWNKKYMVIRNRD